MDPAGTGYSYLAAEDFPRDVTILASTSAIYDENYKKIDTAKGLYNHHNVFFDVGHKEVPAVGCEGGKAAPGMPMSVIMAGATEEVRNRRLYGICKLDLIIAREIFNFRRSIEASRRDTICQRMQRSVSPWMWSTTITRRGPCG
jgi:hypothetical protein